MAHFEALRNSVQALGGDCHASVSSMAFPLAGGMELRGLGTRVALPRGTVVLRVPLAACLTSADAVDERGAALQGALEAACAAEGMPTAQRHFLEMALTLLSPRAAALHGGAYVDALPDGVEHQGSVPSAFLDEALDALQSAPLSALVRQRRRWMSAVLKRVQWDALGGAPAPTAERLAWALFVVRSRLFNVHAAVAAMEEIAAVETGAAAATSSSSYNTWAAGDVRVLAPLLDMMNHAFPPGANTVRTFDGARASFVVTTTRDVAAGEQLCVDYSAGSKAPLPNDRLLLSYGFVLPNNRDDELLIDFRDDFRICFDDAKAASASGGLGSTAAAAAAAQTRLLVLQRGGFTRAANGSNGFSAAGFVVASARDAPAAAEAEAEERRGPGQLLACARACSAPLDAFASPGTAALLLSGRAVSVELELAAVRLLIRKLVTLITAFPTTEHRDVALLGELNAADAGGALAAQLRLAIEFRVAKKRLAQRLLTHFGKQKRALSRMAAKQKREAAAVVAKEEESGTGAGAAGGEG